MPRPVGKYTANSVSMVAEISPARLGYRGHIFCINEYGETFVIKAGDTFEVTGKYALHVEDMAMATPSMVGDRLIIRTAKPVQYSRKVNSTVFEKYTNRIERKLSKG